MCNTMSKTRVFLANRALRCHTCAAEIGCRHKVYVADAFRDGVRLGSYYYCSVECKQKHEDIWKETDLNLDGASHCRS